MWRAGLAGLCLVRALVGAAAAGQIYNPTNACVILPGGVITTAVGNIGGGEDTLMTYPLPAGALGADGAFVRITAWGTAAATGNTKTRTLYFGGTTLQTFAGASNNLAWRFRAEVTRTGAATQEAWGQFWQETDGTDYMTRSAPTETLSGAVTIRVTGTSGSSATDDIVQRMMIVEICNR